MEQTARATAPWHPYPRDYARAQKWARDLLARTDWVVLDTETTGLDDDAEAVQISVVAPDGAIVFGTLLKPTKPIPAEATRIHGITNEVVATAPVFPDVRDRLAELLTGVTVVAYNAAFDSRILAQTARTHQVEPLSLGWSCAMIQYSAFVGDWISFRQEYRYQRLPRGPKYQKHEAAGDCLATLEVIRLMATAPSMPVEEEPAVETTNDDQIPF